MRRFLSLAAAVVVLATVSPAGAVATSRTAWVDPLVADAHGATGAFVHVRAGTDLGRSVARARALGLTLGTTYDEIDVFIARGPAEVVRELASIPQVDALEAIRPVQLSTDSSHVATRGQELLDGELTLPDGTRIDGAGIGVAIVDSGIDGTHPDLAERVVSNIKIVCPSHPTSVYIQPLTRPDECIDPAAKQTVPMEDTDTPSAGGHGTHVAGIVAGEGTVAGGRWHGAAPGASLYGVSIGTVVTVENAVDGLRWVLDNHDQVSPAIRVVNNSWGTATHARYDTAPDHFHSVTWKMQEALIAEGVTVVQAAGNSAGDGTAATTSPECVNPTPGVICVANYNDGNDGRRSGNIDGSSSRGRSDPTFVDTWPDIAAPGTSIISTCRERLPVCSVLGTMVEDPEDSYAAMTGTSMAAPHVAGIVAQILQVDPTLDPAAMEELLEDSAHKFQWGARYALLDPSNPDDSTSFEKGHGLVDVAEAVNRLLDPEYEIPADAVWPDDPPPPVLRDPGPAQTLYLHSTARVNGLDQQAGTNVFSSSSPGIGSGAVATEEWFNVSGPDPSWTGSIEGPLQALKVNFFVKSTDESTHDVGVPPIFHVNLRVGPTTYSFPSFSPGTSALDSVPRQITREFRHYLGPDGPDEGTAADLVPMDIDTTNEPVTLSIGADWFHHAGAIAYDSTEFPSGFSANVLSHPQCAADGAGATPATTLFFRSTTRAGNIDNAIGQTTLSPTPPVATTDARIQDLVVARNPDPAAALDPIWRGGAASGTICSLTLDFWQKQTLDEAILNQVHYLVKLYVGSEAYVLPNLVAPGSLADVTRVTHRFTTMLDATGAEVPLLIEAGGGPIAIELAAQYLDADIETSIFYDSVARPSSVTLNAPS